MSKKTYTKPQISEEQLKLALYEADLKLEAANQKLLKEEAARRELLTNLSHDLRSPIAALVSAVEYLRSGTPADPAAYDQILDLMLRRLKTIQNMIDDLFLLTRIESPTMELSKEAVNAGIFLEDFFYLCQEDAKYAKRHLLLEVPENFNYTVKIDAEKIIRVLDNLFINALRYSEDGADIALGVTYHEDETTSGYVEIYVRDTGIGIAPEHIPLVFQRSFRVSSARTPAQGGSGFGLAIAKSIVERHGGMIRCESRLGIGSCFFFTLPTQLMENSDHGA